MDYRYLKAFILTAEYSSFSKAAQVLNIAQSAVSRQIKLLEKSLNEELIIRSSKKVLLTEKGKKLLNASKQFEEHISDIFETDSTRPLKIGILQGLLDTWFPNVLSSYFSKTDKDIFIDVGDVHQLRQGIEENDYDCIFTTENIQSEIISSLKIFDEKLSLISKFPVGLNNLHDYPWVVYGKGDNLFKISRKKSDRIIKVQSINAIVKIVQAGQGIAVVPSHTLKSAKNIEKKDIKELQESEIFFSTLNFKSMPKSIELLRECVIEASENI